MFLTFFPGKYMIRKALQMQEAAVPMDVSLVIPAYNESAIVLDTIRAVSARLAELAQDYEVQIGRAHV